MKINFSANSYGNTVWCMSISQNNVAQQWEKTKLSRIQITIIFGVYYIDLIRWLLVLRYFNILHSRTKYNNRFKIKIFTQPMFEESTKQITSGLDIS